MTTCPKCGGAVGDDAVFCPWCGERLRPSFSDTTRGIPITLDDRPDEENDEYSTAIENLPRGSALLIVQRGPGEGARYLLDAESTSVGRHPASDIFLDDITVSRHHARFDRRGAQMTISDLGSLNGTYVNRTLIDGAGILRDRDEVQIGKFRLVFCESPLGLA